MKNTDGTLRTAIIQDSSAAKARRPTQGRAGYSPRVPDLRESFTWQCARPSQISPMASNSRELEPVPTSLLRARLTATESTAAAAAAAIQDLTSTLSAASCWQTDSTSG